MKILHLSGATSWGGNEQQMVDLIFGLNKLDVDNIIYCFKGSPVEEYLMKNDLDYYSVEQSKVYSISYAKAFFDFIKDKKIDLIHLHTSDSVTRFVISDLLYSLKVPAVFSKKGISAKKKGLSLFKYNYKKIQKVICVSKAVEISFKETLKPKNHHKLAVIYDGINVDRQKNKSDVNLREKFDIENGKILIGNIANHNRAKDLVTFVETVNVLVHKLHIKDVHFIQIGKFGKYSDKFIPLIKKYNLENYITITGFIDHAMDLISQFDIYLMTSEREGLPITIYESFLLNTPVVSTKAGGIPEAIKHKENGLLSEVKDFNHLAENLKLLIGDEKLRTEFSKKSNKKLFELYTTKQLSEQTLNIYKEVLDEK